MEPRSMWPIRCHHLLLVFDNVSTDGYYYDTVHALALREEGEKDDQKEEWACRWPEEQSCSPSLLSQRRVH